MKNETLFDESMLEEDFSNLTDWESLHSKLIKSVSPVSFTGAKGSTLNEKTPYIKLNDFFNGFENCELLSKSDALSLINENKWTLSIADNTYNYSGFLERDLQFSVFNNDENDTSIAIIAIHVGLDIRAGYSDVFVVSFDDNYGDNYDFLDDFNHNVIVREIKYNGDYIGIDASAMYDRCNVYYNGENYDVSLDLSDDDDEIIEYLKSENILD